MTSQNVHQTDNQQRSKSVSGFIQPLIPDPITRIAHSPGTPSDVPPLPPDRDPPDTINVPHRNPPSEPTEDFPPPVPPPPPAERPQVPLRVAAQR